MSPLLEVKNVTVRYGSARTGMAAVRSASLSIQPGTVLGLAGESGSGKTSLARAIAGLEAVTAGEMGFAGNKLPLTPGRRSKMVRRQIQMIFQDPLSSLNPRMTVSEIVAEPFHVHEPRINKSKRLQSVESLVSKVGLDEDTLWRYPHELSGGQCQRVAIARALALQPQLLLCDEPVSALDVSVQAQIIRLLLDLKKHYGLSMLFISHDLSVLWHVADELAVMYRGEIVEHASTDRFFTSPQHAYSSRLLAAIPRVPAEYFPAP